MSFDGFQIIYIDQAFSDIVHSAVLQLESSHGIPLEP